MPRKPTGNPRGRPPGTGTLGEQTRFTVRIPTELYARLEAFAEGRSYTRGTPQRAGCVRELLEHALLCPYKRQTTNIPLPSEYNNRQTENIPLNAQDNIRQTEKWVEVRSAAREGAKDNKRQTIIVPASSAEPTEAHSASISLPINEHVEPEAVTAEAREETVDNNRQTQNDTPAYDTTRFYLGELCGKGHAYPGTTQSLRRLGKHDCFGCEQERKRQYKARKGQARPA